MKTSLIISTSLFLIVTSGIQIRQKEEAIVEVQDPVVKDVIVDEKAVLEPIDIGIIPIVKQPCC